MKKTVLKSIIFASTLAISLTGLISCGDNGNGNTGGESFGLQAGIDNLRKGFTVKGTLTQRRQFYLDGTFDPNEKVGNPETNQSVLEFKFQNDKEIGTSKTFINEESGLNQKATYFADENLMLYQKQLDENNNVQRNYYYSENIPQVYDEAWANPFLFIDAEDFTYQEASNSYYLNDAKGPFLFGELVGISNGMYDATKYSEFYFDTNNVLSKIVYAPNDRQVIEPDDLTATLKYYIVEQVLELEVSEIGTTILESPTPLEHTSSKHDALATVLNKYDRNFTTKKELTVKASTKLEDLETATPSVSYEKMQFDGTNIFYQKWDQKSGSEEYYDEGKDYCLRPYSSKNVLETNALSYENDEITYIPKNNIGLSNAYQGIATYEDVLPTVKGICPNLFIYDEENDLFRADKSMIRYLAANTLYSTFIPYRFKEANSVTDLTLKIVNDELVCNISAIYFNYFGGQYYKEDHKITYSNPDTTILNKDTLPKVK